MTMEEKIEALREVLTGFQRMLDGDEQTVVARALEAAFDVLDFEEKSGGTFPVTTGTNPELIVEATIPYGDEPWQLPEDHPELGQGIRGELQLLISREQAVTLQKQMAAAFLLDSDNGREAHALLDIIMNMRIRAEHDRAAQVSVHVDCVPSIKERMREAETWDVKNDADHVTIYVPAKETPWPSSTQKRTP